MSSGLLILAGDEKSPLVTILDDSAASDPAHDLTHLAPESGDDSDFPLELDTLPSFDGYEMDDLLQDIDMLSNLQPAFCNDDIISLPRSSIGDSSGDNNDELTCSSSLSSGSASPAGGCLSDAFIANVQMTGLESSCDSDSGFQDSSRDNLNNSDNNCLNSNCNSEPFGLSNSSVLDSPISSSNNSTCLNADLDMYPDDFALLSEDPMWDSLMDSNFHDIMSSSDMYYGTNNSCGSGNGSFSGLGLSDLPSSLLPNAASGKSTCLGSSHNSYNNNNNSSFNNNSNNGNNVQLPSISKPRPTLPLNSSLAMLLQSSPAKTTANAVHLMSSVSNFSNSNKSSTPCTSSSSSFSAPSAKRFKANPPVRPPTLPASSSNSICSTSTPCSSSSLKHQQQLTSQSRQQTKLQMQQQQQQLQQLQQQHNSNSNNNNSPTTGKPSPIERNSVLMNLLVNGEDVTNGYVRSNSTIFLLIQRGN